MDDKTIKPILYISGVGTLGAGVLFIAPAFVLQLVGMRVDDLTGLFFVRHWGLLVACIGALLLYAARRPEIRRPVVLAATAEKLGLVIMTAVNWSEPALQGLRPAALFDGTCAVLFLIYLLRRPASTAAGHGAA